jgi:hypothetical protein
MASAVKDGGLRRPIGPGDPVYLGLRAMEAKLKRSWEVLGLTDEEAAEFLRLKAKVEAAEPGPAPPRAETAEHMPARSAWELKKLHARIDRLDAQTKRRGTVRWQDILKLRALKP